MRASASLPGGVFRRWIAFLLDQLILGSLWLLLAGWTGVMYLLVSRWPWDLGSLTVLAGLLGALGVFLHATYWTVFLGGCGQTPGKMVVGLKVVSGNASPVGYWRSGWRWVAMGLAALPLGLGFVGLLVTRERRGLHDLLAGTRVVRVPRAALR